MAGQFRRAVVTGGTGFLGWRLCGHLLAQGTDVVCLDNFLTSSPPAACEPPDGPPLEFMFCDVAEPFDVAGDVDLVMHLASLASPADYARYPLQTLNSGSLGTRNALELAARKGARFVLASTPEAYGDPIGPRGVYDEAKRYAEALTGAYQRGGYANTAIARIFNSYGPGMRPDDGRMVPAFACQALRGEPLTIHGDGTQTRSLCHADDTVRGLLLLAASDLAGPMNIGNPDEAPVGEIAARIIALAGSSSPIRYVSRPPDDAMSRTPDITLARSLLGFEPRVGWRDGLTETVAWFRQALAGPVGTVPYTDGGSAAGSRPPPPGSASRRPSGRRKAASRRSRLASRAGRSAV
jgi:dTDP-glucose 4,6-dehydratase